MVQQQSDNPINDYESLRLDYEQTTQLLRMLTDIRFKLLTLVPTLTVIAVSLLTVDKAKAEIGPWTVLAIGILGFFATVGIIIYELRNSLFYELSMSRASRLERLLKFPRFSKLCRTGNEPGGVFTERPPRKPPPEQDPVPQYPLSQQFRIFCRAFPIVHDEGLALVYGASLGGWAFIIFINLSIVVINILKIIFGINTKVIFGINNKPWIDITWVSVLSLFIGTIAAVFVAVITVRQFKRLDQERNTWRKEYVELDNLYKAPAEWH